MNMKKIYPQPSRPITRVRLSLLIITAAAGLTACGQKAASSTANYIGIDAAKDAALKAADISADQATLSSAGLDNKNGTFYYQVIFQENGVEYEYAIDALTGVVIEEKHTSLTSGVPAETGRETENTALQDSSDSRQTVVSQQGADSRQNAAAGSAAAAGIDSDTAFSIALSHAGLTEADVTYHQVKEGLENGKRILDVEFMSSDGTEYDYELNAEDGTILSYDYDAEFQYRSAPSAGAGIISEDQAKQTVLDRVPGASAENMAIRLEEDDGRLEYEGKLFYDNTEYEFKIDAYSGGLIEWEAELISAG